MNSYDCPIQHYEMMHRLAREMKALEIQILKHEYHYESFGSWLCVFIRSGKRFRILFDGKDARLVLEANVGEVLKTKWEEVKALDVSERTAEDVILKVGFLLGSIGSTES